MLPYVILLVIILVFGFLREILLSRQLDITKTIAIILCIVLFVFSAIRDSSVGADTRSYQAIFEVISLFSWESLGGQLPSYYSVDLNSVEYGYRYLCKAISVLFKDPQTITVVCSAIFVASLAAFAIGYSRDSWMSILLFVTLGIFQTGLNLAPSSIAALIGFVGLGYLQKGKYLPFLLWVALAAVFHYSALIFLVMMPLRFVVITRKSLILGFAVALAMFVLGPYLLPALSRWIPAAYSGYLSNSANRSQQILVLLFQLILFLVVYFKVDDKERYCASNSLCLWAFLLEIVFYAFALQVTSFARAALLFAPCMLALIPNALNCDGASPRVPGKVVSVAGFVVLLSSLQYIARMMVNNIGSTIPYVVFWLG